jgi:hypothetical protein
MNSDVRRDDFDSVVVHTFARRGRPCWLLVEIESALRQEVYDFDTRGAFEATGYDAFEGEDFERLEAEEARPLLYIAGRDAPDGQRVVLLYEGGLTLACAHSRVGHTIRRRLLKDAATPIFRAARRARLEHRVRETIKQIELEDRTRKAALLHRLVEHARLRGPLAGDDASYVVAMAIVAEVATGHVFPTERVLEDALGDDPNESEGGVRSALLELCEELNT